MKRTLILANIVLLALFSACTSSRVLVNGGNSINKYGISFSCPDEWAVTETENEDGLTSATIEKTGKNSSGMVIIVMVVGESEHSTLAKTYYNSLENSGFENMVLQELGEIYYGKYLMSCTSYQGNMEGLAFRGNFYSTIIDEQTIYVIEQEAIEDITLNKAGFDRIKKTLTLFTK